MIKERRKRSRVPIDFECAITFKNRRIKVRIVNISMSGMRFQQNDLLRVNDECMVILTLNHDTILNIQVKIIRVDEGEAIVSFLSMDEDTFYHLKRLVQFNSPNPDRIEKELEKSAFSQKPI